MIIDCQKMSFKILLRNPLNSWLPSIFRFSSKLSLNLYLTGQHSYLKFLCFKLYIWYKIVFSLSLLFIKVKIYKCHLFIHAIYIRSMPLIGFNQLFNFLLNRLVPSYFSCWAFLDACKPSVKTLGQRHWRCRHLRLQSRPIREFLR